jgi:hypothetical protein
VCPRPYTPESPPGQAGPTPASIQTLFNAAIKHRLGKLDVTPAAFRDQSLGAGAGLLPVLHHDPYRCAEDRVYDAC